MAAERRLVRMEQETIGSARRHGRQMRLSPFQTAPLTICPKPGGTKRRLDAADGGKWKEATFVLGRLRMLWRAHDNTGLGPRRARSNSDLTQTLAMQQKFVDTRQHASALRSRKQLTSRWSQGRTQHADDTLGSV